MNDTPPTSRDATPAAPRTLTPEQFAARYREAYPRLWLIAAGMIGDRSFAEDIVQDAVLIGLDKRDHFIAGTNFTAWLGEIVRRCALNYRRKMRNRATVAADPQVLDRSQVAPAAAATAETWSDMMSADQTSFDDDVMQALATVSDVARCCLLLRTIEQSSYAEIAELLGIPEGTAMSHVHRSKTRLREALRDRYASAETGANPPPGPSAGDEESPTTERPPPAPPP